MSAIVLERAGYTDVTLYEKADRVGGTWRENTYPGVACDVPSHLYCYSFAPNPEWSHPCAPGHEIQAYIENIVQRYQLAPRLRLGEEIVRAEFDATSARWQLETSRGRRDSVDVLIAATGVTHHPRLPDIAGSSTFARAAFHSARWDHSVPLDGQRVGIIGTGSTAVQLVAALSSRVGKLSLFQRTPQWIMPIENAPFSDDRKALFRERPEKLSALRAELERRFTEGFSHAVIDVNSPQLQVIEDTCRAHLEQIVDPVLRAQLRPDYRAACKRLVLSGDFYTAVQRPNVELVVDGIERIEPEGVRTRAGRLHDLDVLVYATGFRTDRFIRPTQIVGRDGVPLDAVWAQRPSAYLSVAVPGFPNFFLLNGPNSPVGNFSLIDVAEMQMSYALQLIDQLRTGPYRQVCPTQTAADSFEDTRVAATKNTVWVTGCKSWYLDDRGVPASWPWTLQRFREDMAQPNLAHFELRT
ncbi:MAG: hypothetical protein RL701_938 [Pseudomonadota bacterium]